jgi:hypothetical protein
MRPPPTLYLKPEHVPLVTMKSRDTFTLPVATIPDWEAWKARVDNPESQDLRKAVRSVVIGPRTYYGCWPSEYNAQTRIVTVTYTHRSPLDTTSAPNRSPSRSPRDVPTQDPTGKPEEKGSPDPR